jgi:hypothetical protein
VADDVDDQEPGGADEPRTDDPAGGDQPEPGIDPVTASPQEYPGKPGT